MGVSKKIIQKLSKEKTKSKASKQVEPVPESESDSASEVEENSAGSDSDDSGEESDDVTEEGLNKIMELLGDVDPAELGLEDEEGSEEDSEIDGEEEYDEEKDSEQDYEDLEIDNDADIVPEAKNVTNDKTALLRLLATFQTSDKTDFFETLTLSYPKELEIEDANDDLKRESEFYKQSLWAATEAHKRFTAASAPFFRPSTYYAEMLKSDAHMSKIRQKLLDESMGMKASEEARKKREGKKFGKKVQVERVQQREKEGRDMVKKVESLRKKRKAPNSEFTPETYSSAVEAAISGEPSSKKRKTIPESQRTGRAKMSRKGRDSKFGVGSGNKSTGSKMGRHGKENNERADRGKSFKSVGKKRPGKSRRK